MIKFAINCLIFGDSFGKSLGDASDIKALSNIPDIFFSLNPCLSANLFAWKLANLDIQSVTKFNVMQLSIPSKSDTTNYSNIHVWGMLVYFHLVYQYQGSIKFDNQSS